MISSIISTDYNHVVSLTLVISITFAYDNQQYHLYLSWLAVSLALIMISSISSTDYDPAVSLQWYSALPLSMTISSIIKPSYDQHYH